MIPTDPKKELEAKKKAEHDAAIEEEKKRNKERDDLLTKQKKQRELDDRERAVSEKKRSCETKKRELHTKEQEMRMLSQEVDRIKANVKQEETLANEKSGQARMTTEAISRDLSREMISKKYRIEFLNKEISKMQVEIESKKREADRLKQEISVIERQSSHETTRVFTRAAANPPTPEKIHRDKQQAGEKEFKLEQMNREIFALKRDIQKDESDIHLLETTLRTLR